MHKLYLTTLQLLDISKTLPLRTEFRFKGWSENMLNQICTVRINAGRGAGHTSTIDKLIRDHYKGALVIFPSSEDYNQFNRIYGVSNGGTITTLGSLDYFMAGNSTKFSIVIVDRASSLTTKEIDSIYASTHENFVYNEHLYLFLQ